MRGKVYLAIAAAIAGIATGHLICSFVQFRTQLGIALGRGPLQAKVDGTGIYESDVTRALGRVHYLNGFDNTAPATSEETRAMLAGLIADFALQTESNNERANPKEVDREYQVAAMQILPSAAWISALRDNGYSVPSLRRAIARNLRAQNFIERQIAGQVGVSTQECLQYYQSHLASYSAPARFRASHLFLASPPETPPEVAERKRIAIEDLSRRIAEGENFSALIASASEDEATKNRGGDLGYFSDWRMPEDFMDAVKNLQVGQISAVVRTNLGFHIIQLSGSLPPQQRTFEQCETEISALLANQKRAATVAQLINTLSHRAEFVRPAKTIE